MATRSGASGDRPRYVWSSYQYPERDVDGYSLVMHQGYDAAVAHATFDFEDFLVAFQRALGRKAINERNGFENPTTVRLDPSIPWNWSASADHFRGLLA